MDLALADLLLRAAVFALATAGAAAFALRGRENAIARDAAVIVGGLGAFVVASAPGVYRMLGPAAFLFETWCLATPAFVWLLAMRLFRDGPPPGRWRHAAPLGLVFVTMPGDYGRFELGLLAGHPQLSEGLLATRRKRRSRGASSSHFETFPDPVAAFREKGGTYDRGAATEIVRWLRALAATR